MSWSIHVSYRDDRIAGVHVIETSELVAPDVPFDAVQLRPGDHLIGPFPDLTSANSALRDVTRALTPDGQHWQEDALERLAERFGVREWGRDPATSQ